MNNEAINRIENVIIRSGPKEKRFVITWEEDGQTIRTSIDHTFTKEEAVACFVKLHPGVKKISVKKGSLLEYKKRKVEDMPKYGLSYEETISMTFSK